jgi:enamine deaminase RidA (YjgF/YER057c/UK114 family)
MGKVEQKLKELGLELPAVPAPLAQYVPAMKAGELLFVSGQVPLTEGRFLHTGKVGAEVTLEQARDCARLCALNCLAAAGTVIGDLDRIRQVVHVRGFVNCLPDFDRQPEVINGASELLVQVFGEAGRHARAAVGTSSLPRNAPVEIEMVLRVEP